MATSIQTAFSKNRAEEIGYDVWQHFVVPIFYQQLDLTTARKPRVIIGGRGCGKTMLLRYLSHQSMFSKLRPVVPEDSLLHIGLYWRADTQFSSAMSKRDTEGDVWQSAFNHMVAIMIGMEVLGSLRSIAESKCEVLTPNDLTLADFTRLQVFEPSLPSSFDDLRLKLEEMLWAFEAWVNDVRKRTQPSFLPGERFLLALIAEIKRTLPALRDAVYYVYLDEYENLSVYQQEIVNTWLKHSQEPLIFNLAMKRHALETKRTIGPESLSNIHDYRTYDLEADFLEQDFSLMAAEILFLKLHMAEVSGLPIDPAQLRAPDRVGERRTPEYKKAILAAARTLFPELSQADLAHGVFADSALRNKLRERIVKALKASGSSLDPTVFIVDKVPEASIVCPALLSRSTLSSEEVLAELKKCSDGDENRFTGPTNWIHNNFVGCLLHLYEPQSRACPFYAGFETFCQISRGNLRHFLELCHKSVNRGYATGIALGCPIPPTQQAEAARQASTAFLREIRSFGRLGNQLHTFVLRVGSLFALAHQRPSQSESEQSHFSIGTGKLALTDADFDFLKEATKWSVLFEIKATKQKSSWEPENVDYVLNPIYAPYFHISFRKKRKLELSSDDAVVLMRGSYEEVSELLRRFSRIWDVETKDAAPTLFSHLDEGEAQ